MTERSEPFLSIVVATRNDDHGGDPLKRLQAFINTLAAQCRRWSLDAEIIVVEWNPPPGRPRVSELCRVPPDAPFSVRFVEVPAHLHQALRFSSVLPLFQMIAKNVGIRRARGRFVLATNIDVIFSNELVEHLASRSLTPGRLYRVDRHDIDSDFPVDAGLDEQMTFCQTRQIRVHARSGTHPVDPFGRMKALAPDIVGSTGFRLGDGWYAREGDSTYGFYRWASQQVDVAIDRTVAPNLVKGAVLDVEVEPNPYQPGSWIDLAILDGERRLAQRRVSRRTRVRVPLDDGVAGHQIVLRTIESSGGREYLPLFECREQLCCRIWHVGVGTAPSHQYDIASWRRESNDNPKLLVEHTSAGVEITTDPGSVLVLRAVWAVQGAGGWGLRVPSGVRADRRPVRPDRDGRGTPCLAAIDRRRNRRRRRPVPGALGRGPPRHEVLAVHLELSAGAAASRASSFVGSSAPCRSKSCDPGSGIRSSGESSAGSARPGC